MLSKLIGLLFLFCSPSSLFCIENSKNTRKELARPVMGTIFLVYIYMSVCMSTVCQNTRMLKVSLGRLKLTGGIRVIHFNYTLEQL